MEVAGRGEEEEGEGTEEGEGDGNRQVELFHRFLHRGLGYVGVLRRDQQDNGDAWSTAANRWLSKVKALRCPLASRNVWIHNVFMHARVRGGTLCHTAPLSTSVRLKS